MCRSWRELSNASLLAKFGFDTAENEPSKLLEAKGLDFENRRASADEVVVLARHGVHELDAERDAADRRPRREARDLKAGSAGMDEFAGLPVNELPVTPVGDLHLPFTPNFQKLTNFSPNFYKELIKFGKFWPAFNDSILIGMTNLH